MFVVVAQTLHICKKNMGFSKEHRRSIYHLRLEDLEIPLKAKNFMEDCMSLFRMVCLAKKKCYNFLKQRELRGGVGSILLSFFYR